MPKPKLIFYLDLHSGYSYLAYSYIRSSKVFQECDIVYVPVLFVAFVKAGLSIVPWDNKNKVEYLQRDIARWARQMNIPWKPGYPEGFPLTKVSDVQRVVVACTILCPDRVGEVYDALFHAFWFEKKGVQLRNVYEPILRDVLGTELACRVVEMSKSDEVRATLYKNTEQAMAESACGLPWFTAYNEQGERDDFWGFDHLGQVITHLGIGKLPLPHL